MTRGVQVCATDGCEGEPAFRTRTKPAWCADCIEGIFRDGGVQLLEPFAGGASDWQLSQCLICGTPAHYRLEYVLACNERKEPVCRACFWRRWAANGRAEWEVTVLQLLQTYSADEIAMMDPRQRVLDFLDAGWWRTGDIVANLYARDFELVSQLTPVTALDDPVLARCLDCGRLQAARMRDLDYGCECLRGPRAQRVGSVWLLESDSEAVHWWDHAENSPEEAATVTLKARREFHWMCPTRGHKFKAPAFEMTFDPKCPHCTEELKGRTVAEVPELAAAWADEMSPADVLVVGSGPHRFRCSAGHHPRVLPLTFLVSGCGYCRRKRDPRPSSAGILSEIATQWHPTLNESLSPDERGTWWLASCCGYAWQESVASRDRRRRWRCPKCRTLLNSLAWQDPGLAAEWSANNPLNSWQVRPTSSTPFDPEWVCSTDPSHRWKAPLASRSSGSGCPECRTAGKSQVELAHFQAAQAMFDVVRSGAVVPRHQSKGRGWRVDILVEDGSEQVVIEYDGAYWHSGDDHHERDRAKSQDLLAAGYRVARLREAGLASLNIRSDKYLEMTVYPTAPRPVQVLTQIRDWVAGLPPQ